jgi:hypothetical protein
MLRGLNYSTHCTTTVDDIIWLQASLARVRQLGPYLVRRQFGSSLASSSQKLKSIILAG